MHTLYNLRLSIYRAIIVQPKCRESVPSIPVYWNANRRVQCLCGITLDFEKLDRQKKKETHQKIPENIQVLKFGIGDFERKVSRK